MHFISKRCHLVSTYLKIYLRIDTNEHQLIRYSDVSNTCHGLLLQLLLNMAVTSSWCMNAGVIISIAKVIDFIRVCHGNLIIISAKVDVSGKGSVQLLMEFHLRATECHLPYGITY